MEALLEEEEKQRQYSENLSKMNGEDSSDTLKEVLADEGSDIDEFNNEL